jgi:hypothetical protein
MRSRKFSPKTALARSLTKKNTRPSPSIQPRPIPPSREELGSTENCLPEVQIDFAELENGSLVEVVEDPNDPNHTLVAIFNHGHIRLAERVEDRERILVGFSDHVSVGERLARPSAGCAVRDIAVASEFVWPSTQRAWRTER